MRIVDLSATIAPSRPDALPFERVEISYSSHAEGASHIETMLKVSPDLLRNNEGWAVEEFTKLATHSVTHVDSPWDYKPPSGFKVACFPLKIQGGSAGPARAVAILSDEP